MTVVQYLKETGVATSAELMAYAKVDKNGFEGLKQMAREQAKNLGIVLEEPIVKAV